MNDQSAISEDIREAKEISRKVSERLKNFCQNAFLKLQANKRLVILISGISSFLLILIVVGIAFGTKITTSPKLSPSPTPSPTSQTTPDVNQPDFLDVTGVKLKEIRERIFTMDVAQKHLQPPAIKFDIKF